jgi:hypothetical protein
MYIKWLDNFIMLRKAKEKCVCVCVRAHTYLIDLNIACFKQSLPLSKIDKLVDLINGFIFLNSLDKLEVPLNRHVYKI